jgi:hypothetical protein
MKNYFYLLLFMLFISGCTNNSGTKIVPAGGTLTQNGKPLVDVRLEFRHVDTGATAFAETDTSGKFTLTHTQGESGAEPGKYFVSVFQKGKPLSLPAGVKAEDLPEERRNPMSPEVEIRNSDKSPIETEIPDKGNNDLKIEIK